LPRPERPAVSFAPGNRECPPGSSSPISPRAPPEYSVSSADAPSASYVPAVAAAAGSASGSADSAVVDDGAAWIPSAACARGIHGNWPGSSSPRC